MKILIIRHGDPDYENDTLTEKGWREAELLAQSLSKQNISSFYCSILGRARDTLQPLLRQTGMTAQYFDWLREFNYVTVDHPYSPGHRWGVWDFMPSWWTQHPSLAVADEWLEHPIIRESDVPAAHKAVCDGFDGILAQHGYCREGQIYRVTKSNHDTIAFVCHLGIEAVLMGHLLGTSPLIFSQGFGVVPSSVTTLISEERQEGIAVFRCQTMGSVDHLTAAGEPLSFQGRFCECFSDDTRH